MVVIWGWNSKRHPISLFYAGCHACGGRTEHVRILQKTAFTLYFIPFLPVRSKKLVVCARCGTEKPDAPGLDGVPIGGEWGPPTLPAPAATAAILPPPPPPPPP